MTRERKIYAAVLLIAGGALAADQLFFGGGHAGPAAAEARVASPRPAAAPVTPELDPEQFDFKAVSLNDANSLSHRLKSVARDHALHLSEVGDAFRPDESWLPRQESQLDTSQPAPDKHHAFVAKHRLMAVMTGRTGLAMIDGKPLRVGEELDGFTLEAVTSLSATFKSPGGETVLLQLQTPATQNPGKNR